MTEDKKNKKAKDKTPDKFDMKITGLDIDKAEYQEIVLSHSNFPDRYFDKQNYYD